MKLLISVLLLLIVNAVAVLTFPAILVDRSDQIDRARTLNLNAFDLLGLFGKRGGFLRPLIQNTIGNGNGGMTLQTGITLLNSLFSTDTGGSGGLLKLNLV